MLLVIRSRPPESSSRTTALDSCRDTCPKQPAWAKGRLLDVSAREKAGEGDRSPQRRQAGLCSDQTRFAPHRGEFRGAPFFQNPYGVAEQSGGLGELLAAAMWDRNIYDRLVRCDWS